MEQLKRQVWFVYAGENGDFHVYYIIDEQARNNGEKIGEERTFYAEKKIFKSGIGAVHEVTLVNEDSVSYKKASLPVSIWKHRGDLAAWKARDAASKAVSNLEAYTKENHLAKYLEPLRDQYWKCKSRTQRTALLAEVIRIITS